MSLLSIAVALISVAVGSFVTWLVSGHYYRKSKNELKSSYENQTSILNKLPDVLRSALADGQQGKLTVKELSELIKKKTTVPGKTGIDRFIACPECGSQKLKSSSESVIDSVDKYGDVDAIHMIYFLACEDCGWHEQEEEL